MIGPSVTGILIAAFGGTVGFGLAALASCTALALYSRLDVREDIKPGDGRRVLTQLAEGVGFVAGNFVFASLISLALFNALFGLSYITLLPVYADTYFGMGSTGYGLLSAAHGAGSMLGTLIIATAAERFLRPGKIMLTAATCMGVALMLFSRSPGMGVAVPMLALTGFCSTFYLTHVTTIIQQTVPDHLRGRVLSLYSLCWNLLPLGGLIAGALAAAVDARFAVLVGGVLVAGNALALSTSRRLRALGLP